MPASVCAAASLSTKRYAPKAVPTAMTAVAMVSLAPCPLSSLRICLLTTRIAGSVFSSAGIGGRGDGRGGSVILGLRAFVLLFFHEPIKGGGVRLRQLHEVVNPLVQRLNPRAQRLVLGASDERHDDGGRLRVHPVSLWFTTISLKKSN